LGCTPFDFNIGYIDLNTKEFTGLIPRPQNSEFGTIRAIDWLDDNHIIWTDKKGLHKINIGTVEMQTIKETCENFSYSHLSVSPTDKNILLLTRLERTLIGFDTIYSDQDIVLFDIDTGLERIIDLEE
jgi:hypothetical protein